jgi:hypothetical protein
VFPFKTIRSLSLTACVTREFLPPEVCANTLEGRTTRRNDARAKPAAFKKLDRMKLPHFHLYDFVCIKTTLRICWLCGRRVTSAIRCSILQNGFISRSRTRTQSRPSDKDTSAQELKPRF